MNKGDGSGGDEEKCLDFGYALKVQPRRIANESDVWGATKKTRIIAMSLV